MKTTLRESPWHGWWRPKGRRTWLCLADGESRWEAERLLAARVRDAGEVAVLPAGKRPGECSRKPGVNRSA